MIIEFPNEIKRKEKKKDFVQLAVIIPLQSFCEVVPQHKRRRFYEFIITRIDMGQTVMPRKTFIEEVAREMWILVNVDDCLENMQFYRLNFDKSQASLFPNFLRKTESFFDTHILRIRSLRQAVIDRWNNGLDKKGHWYNKRKSLKKIRETV